MNRSELIQRMVLNEMCDDYENIDQIILPNVAKDCAKLGITVERPEIVKALSELIEAGLAKAYLLSSREPFCTEIQGTPPFDAVEVNFRNLLLPNEKGNGFPPF